MAAASPIEPRRSELDVAVDKIRAGEPLTERERALVHERGEDLIADDFTDELPPPGAEWLETTPEEDEELLEDAVVADADKRQGVRGITREELFARLRAIG